MNLELLECGAVAARHDVGSAGRIAVGREDESVRAIGKRASTQQRERDSRAERQRALRVQFARWLLRLNDGMAAIS